MESVKFAGDPDNKKKGQTHIIIVRVKENMEPFPSSSISEIFSYAYLFNMYLYNLCYSYKYKACYREIVGKLNILSKITAIAFL